LGNLSLSSGYSIEASRRLIIPPFLAMNFIPIKASYFARFPTNIILSFVTILPISISTLHCFWLFERDPFIAIWTITGVFIYSVGIPYVYTKVALIMSRPIAPVSNRTLASRPAIRILPSRATLGLIPCDWVLYEPIGSAASVGTLVLLIHTSVVSLSELSHSALLTAAFFGAGFPFPFLLLRQSFARCPGFPHS